MSIDMKQFLVTFYEESFEGLDTMETELLNLDIGEADPETVNTIFRAAHSIKGGSGTFGLNDVASFTHLMETLLDEVRDGRRQVSQKIVDVLLTSVDVLRDMLSTLRDEGEVDMVRVQAAQQLLDELLGDAAETVEATTAADSADTGSQGWKIHFRPHPGMLQTGNDPVRMFRELASLGTLKVECDTSGLPALDKLVAEESYLAWNLELAGEVDRASIDEIFEWVEGDCDLVVEPLRTQPSAADVDSTKAGEKKAPEPVTPASAGKSAASEKRRSASTESGSIRVSIDKIDDLINMMGELVITQSMLSQLGEAEEFETAQIEKLRDGLSQLERNTREMQENVMRIRMLPISFAFQRFPRLVHDLSGTLNKKIELKMSGENTELDKTVMEKIGDPLVHLVRNSIDHGIESPEVRLAAGKDEMGLIELNACHEGGNIVIEIIDDGAGLNRERILQKAISNGLIGEDESLTDEQIYDMIFQPGFSTAEVVSDVSGRGVGMDVVRRNIRALGGSVEVTSQPGQGSKFTIRLPLTLAILDGQSVRVGNDIYIIPLVSIIESLQVNPADINSLRGSADVYRLRDEYIPIVRLYDIFNVDTEIRNWEDGLLVIVEGEGTKVALFVDDLLGQQQVVIKSLETNFRKVEGISGATILGDGTVALILDITSMIQLSRDNGPEKTSGRPDNAEQAA